MKVYHVEVSSSSHLSCTFPVVEKYVSEKPFTNARRSRKYSILVDNLFVLAMLFVLIGHADVVDYYRTLWIYKWIYLFHMPLFFCISGYLFALTDSSSLKINDFIKKRAFRLLIPLVVITTIGFVLKSQIGATAERPVEMNLVSYLHCFLYPGDNPVAFLWFLTVLFEIQILVFAFCKFLVPNEIRYIKWLIPVFIALLYCVPEINFLCISRVIYFIVFFISGILFCKYEMKIINYFYLRSLGMMILLGALSISSPYIFQSIYLKPLYALIGILFSISFVLNLQKRNIKIFPKLRKYTYTIFLLSWFFQSFCRTILMPYFIFSYWPYISIVSFVSGLFISYGIGVLANNCLMKGVLARYLRISIGL